MSSPRSMTRRRAPSDAPPMQRLSHAEMSDLESSIRMLFHKSNGQVSNVIRRFATFAAPSTKRQTLAVPRYVRESPTSDERSSLRAICAEHLRRRKIVVQPASIPRTAALRPQTLSIRFERDSPSLRSKLLANISLTSLIDMVVCTRL